MIKSRRAFLISGVIVCGGLLWAITRKQPEISDLTNTIGLARSDGIPYDVVASCEIQSQPPKLAYSSQGIELQKAARFGMDRGVARFHELFPDTVLNAEGLRYISILASSEDPQTVLEWCLEHQQELPSGTSAELFQAWLDTNAMESSVWLNTVRPGEAKDLMIIMIYKYLIKHKQWDTLSPWIEAVSDPALRNDLTAELQGKLDVAE